MITLQLARQALVITLACKDARAWDRQPEGLLTHDATRRDRAPVRTPYVAKCCVRSSFALETLTNNLGKYERTVRRLCPL